MKTLTAEQLKARKDNLRAEFDTLNGRSMALQAEMIAGKKEYGKLQTSMLKLQAQYALIEELEKELGVKDGAPLEAQGGEKPEAK